MDERFGRRRTWIIVGAVVAIVFLCLALCGLGAMVTMFARSGVVLFPASPGAEVAVPQVFHGPLGLGQHGGFGLLRFLGLGFGLLFFGLILLLLFGMAKRLLWGPAHYYRRHGGPRHWGKPPEGKEWKGKPHPPWGPWAWHHHGEPPEAEEESSGEEPGSEESEPPHGKDE